MRTIRVIVYGVEVDVVQHADGTFELPPGFLAKAGWGTALKPSYEPIVVARKPLIGTLAENILTHGVGPINIDGCRISTSDNLNGGAYAKNPTERYDGTENWRYKRGGGRSSLPGDERTDAGAGMFAPGSVVGSAFIQPAGRWPSNTVFSHSDLCVRVGSREGKSYVINRFTDGAEPFGGGAGHTFETTKQPVSEEDVYACVPGCPIRELDRQTTTDKPKKKARKGKKGSLLEAVEQVAEDFAEVAASGASQFFNRFSFEAEDFPPFIHISKPARKEKELGCEHLPARSGAETVGRKEGSAGLNNPRAGAGRTATQVRNMHPTVKSVMLMRHLCTLVTPPGGTVLDPFMGSGTTGIAAIREGFSFIGIEREHEYMPIAEARISHALGSGVEAMEVSTPVNDPVTGPGTSRSGPARLPHPPEPFRGDAPPLPRPSQGDVPHPPRPSQGDLPRQLDPIPSSTTIPATERGRPGKDPDPAPPSVTSPGVLVRIDEEKWLAQGLTPARGAFGLPPTTAIPIVPPLEVVELPPAQSAGSSAVDVLARLRARRG